MVCSSTTLDPGGAPWKSQALAYGIHGSWRHSLALITLQQSQVRKTRGKNEMFSWKVNGELDPIGHDGFPWDGCMFT